MTADVDIARMVQRARRERSKAIRHAVVRWGPRLLGAAVAIPFAVLVVLLLAAMAMKAVLS